MYSSGVNDGESEMEGIVGGSRGSLWFLRALPCVGKHQKGL